MTYRHNRSNSLVLLCYLNDRTRRHIRIENPASFGISLHLFRSGGGWHGSVESPRVPVRCCTSTIRRESWTAFSAIARSSALYLHNLKIVQFCFIFIVINLNTHVYLKFIKVVVRSQRPIVRRLLSGFCATQSKYKRQAVGFRGLFFAAAGDVLSCEYIH